jgi:hypothetical protein
MSCMVSTVCSYTFIYSPWEPHRPHRLIYSKLGKHTCTNCTHAVNRWSGWAPPTTAGVDGVRLRVLAQTLAALSQALPKATVGPADVADPEAAAQCFQRILPQAEASEQFLVLADLLGRVWDHGRALGSAAPKDVVSCAHTRCPPSVKRERMGHKKCASEAHTPLFSE